MKKIPTLFTRIFDDHHHIIDILPDINPDLRGINLLDLIPTLKWDGSACAVLDGTLFKRYDAKGKNIPENARPCQAEPDPVTGHFPCWVPCNRDDPADRWFWAAFDNTDHIKIDYETYEAVGPHFQGNPYHFGKDVLKRHGEDVLDVEKNFDAIKKFLTENYIEGIVFWNEWCPVCKIKRSDFGLEWNRRKNHENHA